jgi:hypothetical protein
VEYCSKFWLNIKSFMKFEFDVLNNVVAFLHFVFVIVNFVSHVYEMFFSTYVNFIELLMGDLIFVMWAQD